MLNIARKSRPHTIRESRGDRAFNTVVNLVLVIFGLVTLYPLLYVLSASISDPLEVNAGNILLFPKGIQWEGYQRVFRSQWILTGYRNSLLYTLFGTTLNVFVTFITAYALSRRDLYGRGIITLYMLIPMWFGGGLIPTFLIVNSVGLVNSPLVMIILGMISMYNCVICRTFIQTTIPYELQEASRIDGASDFGILWRVIFPLSGPVLAILALYYALGHWNAYFNALIYLSDRNVMPLQLFLREVLIQNQAVAVDKEMSYEQMMEVMQSARIAQVMKYALIVVASAPMLAIYPFVQKFFVKGVMIGSLKG